MTPLLHHMKDLNIESYLKEVGEQRYFLPFVGGEVMELSPGLLKWEVVTVLKSLTWVCRPQQPQHVPELLVDAMRWFERTGGATVCFRILQLGHERTCFIALQFIFTECKRLHTFHFWSLRNLPLTYNLRTPEVLSGQLEWIGNKCQFSVVWFVWSIIYVNSAHALFAHVQLRGTFRKWVPTWRWPWGSWWLSLLIMTSRYVNVNPYQSCAICTAQSSRRNKFVYCRVSYAEEWRDEEERKWSLSGTGLWTGHQILFQSHRV